MHATKSMVETWEAKAPRQIYVGQEQTGLEVYHSGARVPKPDPSIKFRKQSRKVPFMHTTTNTSTVCVDERII